MKKLLFAASMLGVLANFPVPAAEQVRLITIDPGHFHAALVQKFMYPQVDPVVHVYAPQGPDLDAHLKRIEGFNTRADKPTSWQEKVYAGPDFFSRMIREKPGNVAVIAGNNTRKTEYIDECVKAGLHVLADKPMVISAEHFAKLQDVFNNAAKKKLLVYDIMTERSEITTTLQRELARMPEVFGTLEKGTAGQPAVVMESVHHFFKEVAGKPLIRPAWFFDVNQEGEAIVDVGSHLVDLVQWECFPEQSLNWRKDIKVRAARRWPTKLTPAQFKQCTGLDQFPDFLKKDVGADGVLNVFQNGEMAYTIRGIHVKLTALWNFEAPPGAKDTHYSVLRGSRSSLVIKQGAEQKYRATLYVEKKPNVPADEFERQLKSAVVKLSSTYPGVDLRSAEKVWEIIVPEKYDVGHEAHFGEVTSRFLRYLADGKLPDWEEPNMIAKYYTTTEALRLAHLASPPGKSAAKGISPR